MLPIRYGIWSLHSCTHGGVILPTMTRVGRAAEKLQDAAGEMAHVATVVEATSQPMARRDPLRKHMDLIYQEVSHVPNLSCTFLDWSSRQTCGW